jgi:hypothetical protein
MRARDAEGFVAATRMGEVRSEAGKTMRGLVE